MERLEIADRLLRKYTESVEVNVKGGLYWVAFSTNHEKLLEVGNYFDLRNGEISFCPKGKEQQFTESGKWARKNRVVIRPAKFFKLLDVETRVRQRAFDLANNVLEIEQSTIINRAFEILTGKVLAGKLDVQIRVSGQISRVYGIREAYESESGTVANSCMRLSSTHDCHDFAAFYDNIPGLKIMYATKEEDGCDLLIARALLWCTDQGMYLDRIYANEKVSAIFLEVAQSHGWKTRVFYSQYDSELTFTSGLNLHLKFLNTGGAPYFDTLYYLLERDQLSNREKSEGSCIPLQDSSGNFPQPKLCHSCGAEMMFPQRDGEELHTGDDWVWVCRHCMETKWTCCYDCSTLVPRDAEHMHMYYGSELHWCDRHFERYFVPCPHCGTVHHTNETCTCAAARAERDKLIAEHAERERIRDEECVERRRIREMEIQMEEARERELNSMQCFFDHVTFPTDMWGAPYMADDAVTVIPVANATDLFDRLVSITEQEDNVEIIRENEG